MVAVFARSTSAYNKPDPMIGKTFHRLTVVAKLRKRQKGTGLIRYRCICECGNETKVIGYGLRKGLTKSCGCLHIESAAQQGRDSKTHGMRHEPEYYIWCSMVQRCTNPNDQAYHNYGGRGIKVCKRWMKFENFYKDMGDRPEGLTLDRKDNDGDYTPKNCRWATREQQANNLRINVIVSIDGRQMTLKQAARKSNYNYKTAHWRYKKYGLDNVTNFIENRLGGL